MKDYETLDLSGICHVDLADLELPEGVGLGEQLYRGLPFLLGGNGRLAVAGGSHGGVTVPIGSVASRVIVAHRVLDLPEGASTGALVATYVFHMKSGAELAVPIREHFEITSGHEPANAVGIDKPALVPRYEGRWDDMSLRQKGAKAGAGLSFPLWTWKNPEPGAIIESLEIVPNGARIVIAAITLGHLDEHPFARQGRRPVRIVLKSEKDTGRPFDLAVDVDRGDPTYVYPLPDESPEEFLDSPYKGWGQHQNTSSSPAYVEVSAVPSATVKVRHGDEEVGSFNWGELEEKGVVETPRMQVALNPNPPMDRDGRREDSGRG